LLFGVLFSQQIREDLVRAATSPKIFAHKQTLNNTFASAVRLMHELVVEQTFSEMKFGNATNLLDSDKRSLSALSKNKHRSKDKYRHLHPLIVQL